MTVAVDEILIAKITIVATISILVCMIGPKTLAKTAIQIVKFILECILKGPKVILKTRGKSILIGTCLSALIFATGYLASMHYYGCFTITNAHPLIAATWILSLIILLSFWIINALMAYDEDTWEHINGYK